MNSPSFARHVRTIQISFVTWFSVQTSGIPNRSRGQPIHQNGEALILSSFTSLSHFFFFPPPPPLPPLFSQNKNLDVNAGPALVHSPSSAGTRAQACDSKRRLSVRPAQRRATYAKRVSSISNTTSQRRSGIPRLARRTRLRRARLIGSIMRRIRRQRYVGVKALNFDKKNKKGFLLNECLHAVCWE